MKLLDVLSLSASRSPPQVYQFSTKQTEMALRVAALDYLGTVAAHLRKDTVDNGLDKTAVEHILKEVTLIMCQVLW